jgi:hypothetical protein
MQRLGVGGRLSMSVQLASLAYPFAETFALMSGYFLLVFVAVGAIALLAN